LLSLTSLTSWTQKKRYLVASCGMGGFLREKEGQLWRQGGRRVSRKEKGEEGISLASLTE